MPKPRSKGERLEGYVERESCVIFQGGRGTGQLGKAKRKGFEEGEGEKRGTDPPRLLARNASQKKKEKG